MPRKQAVSHAHTRGDSWYPDNPRWPFIKSVLGMLDQREDIPVVVFVGGRRLGEVRVLGLGLGFVFLEGCTPTSVIRPLEDRLWIFSQNRGAIVVQRASWRFG